MRDDPVEMLNFVANQPEVLKEVAPSYEWVDLSKFFTNPANKMFGDDRGVVIFGHHGNGVYEMHYLFSDAIKGAKVLRTVRDAIKKMFTEHQATAICGLTPRENLPARMINRALGGVPIGEKPDVAGRPCILYRLEREKWAQLSADSSAA